MTQSGAHERTLNKICSTARLFATVSQCSFNKNKKITEKKEHPELQVQILYFNFENHLDDPQDI